MDCVCIEMQSIDVCVWVTDEVDYSMMDVILNEGYWRWLMYSIEESYS